MKLIFFAPFIPSIIIVGIHYFFRNTFIKTDLEKMQLHLRKNVTMIFWRDVTSFQFDNVVIAGNEGIDQFMTAYQVSSDTNFIRFNLHYGNRQIPGVHNYTPLNLFSKKFSFGMSGPSLSAKDIQLLLDEIENRTDHKPILTPGILNR